MGIELQERVPGGRFIFYLPELTRTKPMLLKNFFFLNNCLEILVWILLIRKWIRTLNLRVYARISGLKRI